MPDHDVTVTGSFTPNQYNLTYIVDGQLHKYTRVAYGTELTPEPAPTKEGYTFSGWSEIPATMPAHDVTIIGSFTINQYTLTYILDGETYNTSKVDYGTELTPEPTPAKEGYTFSGWSEIPATMPAHDVTVTGTFNINVHTLKYIVDGAVYKTYEVAYGTDITPEAEPTKDGYTFSGWSEIPATMPDHDVRVTGTFKEGLFCAKPTITYENGELVFSCETPGATCISTITADDMGTVVGNRRPLTATYFIKVYAMANGYEDSKMTMALICWMDETSLPVNIEEVEMNEVKARPVLIQNQGGTLVLNGVDDGAEVCVYDLNGRLMGSGTATDGTTRISTKLTSGQVAIVRMGSKSVKVKMQ